MTSKAYLMKDYEDWDWRDLRDYVESSYEGRSENYQTNSVQEASIFRSFLKRWPDNRGILIARYAITICDGLWNGIPVTPLNFRKDYDEVFADPISKLIGD